MGTLDAHSEAMFPLPASIMIMLMHISTIVLYVLSIRVKSVASGVCQSIKSLMTFSPFMLLIAVLAISSSFSLLIYSIVAIYLAMSFCTIILYCRFVIGLPHN